MESKLKVIELFAGLGSQTQALKHLDIEHEVVAISEIDRFAEQSYTALHGKPNNLGDITKIEALPTADLWTYSFPCFPADTLVLTDKGYRRIADIEPGEKVLTHTNHYLPVTAKYNNGIKPCVKVKTMNSHELICTPNHRFYVRKMYRQYHPENNRKSGALTREFTSPEWVEAEKLTKEYYVGFAINQNANLPEWNGIVHRRKKGRWNLHEHTLSPLFTNKDFWWLIGRWVADGHERKTKMGSKIVFNIGKAKSAEFDKVISRVFHYNFVDDRTSHRYIVSSNELQSFIEQFGKLAHGKFIPAFALDLPVQYLEAFFDGYMSGDGCYTNGRFKISTVSEKLAYGLGAIIAKVFKRPFSMYKTKRPHTTTIEGRTVNQRDTYSLMFSKSDAVQDKAFYENGLLWFPIYNVEQAVNNEVFDITVETDHSFTANGAIVHNCTDISNAGKQAGLAKGSGTRSGLLWEVERLLLTAKDTDALPKYLLLENVKALVGKKFKHEFDTWLSFLETLGYTNYWQVLNAKNYAIPQNRERVFVVSIRGEHTPYKFPKPRELRLRLKDMLDTEVDEKFYLSERALMSLGHSSFNQERNRLQDIDGVHRACCSRDFKSPSCVKVGELFGGRWEKAYSMNKRVFDTAGIAPALNTCMGGGLETKIIDDTYKGREPREYAEISPTIRGKSYDFKVVAGKKQPVDHHYKDTGVARSEHIEFRKDDLAGTVISGNDNHFVAIVASRGRNPENPSDRTAGSPTQQRLEPNFSGCTNTLTSVGKDNLVLESAVLTPKRTEYGKAIRKEYEAGDIDESRHNMTELVPRTDGMASTITTVTKDNLLAEAPYITDGEAESSKCVRASGHGLHYGHTWDVIADSARIRKLTPTECLRLMGWRDCEIKRVQAAGISNAQQYKQAGNGIVSTVLIAIFGEMFNVPYSHILDNWSWREVSDDS